MHRMIRRKHFETVLITAILLLSMAGPASAATFYLRADTITKTMPDSAVITMWGFAECTDGTYTSCGLATVPGPALSVPAGDTSLTINLKNNLTGLFIEPVSIIIPGQSTSMAPVKFTDLQG